MATSVTYNGVLYSVPSYGDGGYAQGPGNLSLYLIALSTGSLQQTGGPFPITADVNFGPNFGLIALYYTSETANPATAGQIRLAHTDTIDWRNNANSGNLALGVNSSDQLTFNGTPLTGGFVTSIIGTAHEIIVSSPTGVVTLSTPQPIDTTSSVTFAQVTAGIMTDTGLTPHTALIADGSDNIASSVTTDTELSYVHGVTSAIQTQLNGKQATGSYALTDLSNVSGVSADVSLNGHKLTDIANGTATADAVNFGQLPAQSGTITNWTTYNAAPGGFNSPAGQAYWRRVGDTLEVKGYYTAATFAAADVSLNLPSVTIDNSKLSTMVSNGTMLVGFAAQLQNSGGNAQLGDIFYDNVNLTQVFYSFSQDSTGPSFLKRNADAIFGASTPTALTFNFTVPILGWSI
jgi:hypothetical protein